MSNARESAGIAAFFGASGVAVGFLIGTAVAVGMRPDGGYRTSCTKLGAGMFECNVVTVDKPTPAAPETTAIKTEEKK